MGKQQDRIFDARLAERFQRQIYGKARGQIRLAIVQDDLQELLGKDSRAKPLQVLDMGGGFGQMAIWATRQGHSVTLVEPSPEMLALARASIREHGLESRIQSVEASLQEWIARNPEPVDVIIFHAVLEWLAEPQAALQQLLRCLKPGGWLSLMFFNHHSAAMRRLMMGDLKTVSGNALGSDGNQRLVPISPLKPQEVLDWLPGLGLQLHLWTGVRCFYDYMQRNVRGAAKLEDILPLERGYSRQEPWRSMARYQHMLCRKEAASALAD